MASKYLAFDFGAESGRAMLGVIDGEKIQLEEIHRFPNRQININGHFHWDVLALFHEIKQGLTIAAQKGHKDLNGIAVDTWGVDFGLLDKKGNLISNPYCYRDSRTDGIPEEVFNIMPFNDIYAVTGIQQMQLNSIYQLYSMVKEKSPLLEIADTLLFMPDLFTYLLTGEKVCEYTIASTSQMLNAKNKKWDANLFEKLGLPLNIMKKPVKPGTIVGKLRKDICTETGVNPVDVIAVGAHDTASAVAAVPAEGDDWAYLSSGTWSLIGVELDKPVLTEASLKAAFTNEGGVDGKIRFLKNISGMWLLQQCKKSWEKGGRKYEYDQLMKLAGGSQLNLCTIDPNDKLFLNPPDMPSAILEYCKKTKQQGPSNPGEFVRCIFESLALKYAQEVQEMNAILGKKIKTLHIVGGGSRNDILNQLTAERLGVKVVAGPVEATAIGNIIVQALAKKQIKTLVECRKLVAGSFGVKTFQSSMQKG